MNADKIPFAKAHGARNDFLLTWTDEAPAADLPAVARAICDRHTGIGADGWMLVSRAGEGYDCAIRLFNSDGSEPELSGNGTRCAAAFLIDHGFSGSDIRILTGAGTKHLHLVERSGRRFVFDMNMGRAEIVARNFALPLSSGSRDVTLVSVGNPQCVVPVADFDFDWRAMGAEIERHPYFPNRTNVSFIRPVNEHALEVLFWERGAGETMSSGTGSTGAVAAALARGMVKSPVEARTPAGPLRLREDGGTIYLTGPAEIIGEGMFFQET